MNRSRIAAVNRVPLRFSIIRSGLPTFISPKVAHRALRKAHQEELGKDPPRINTHSAIDFHLEPGHCLRTEWVCI